MAWRLRDRAGALAIWARAWLIAAVIAGFAPLAWAVVEQDPAPLNEPPPVRSAIDANGVDLSTGSYGFSSTDVSIGQPGQGGLAFTRSFMGSGWRHNFVGTLHESPTNTFTVSLGLASETFTLTGGAYVSEQARGSTLEYDASRYYTYTTSSGAAARFDNTLADGGADFDANRARIVSLTHPNGEVVTFHYNSAGAGGESARRLQSVTNNLGYQLHFEYANNSPTQAAHLGPWKTLTKVTAINNAVDYCNPTANTCGLSGWPTATYTVSSPYFIITDALSRQTRINGALAGQITHIRRPSSNSADHVTITYSNGRVATISNGEGTWTYSYSSAGGNLTTTVTDPQSNTRVVVADIVTGVIESDTDGAGRVTTYTYDANERLTRVEHPEDNATEVVYDARGNVTSLTEIAKPSSGLSNTVTSAVYPACTGANRLICNQPTSVTDAREFRTDFTYDEDHGGLLTVTQAAPTGDDPIGSGIRPQTRYAYDDFYAYYKNSGGSIVQAPSAVVRLTEISSCATTASCDAGPDETLATITYGSTGVANNLLPVSSTTAAGNNAISVVVAMTYDAVGNLLTRDGPLADDTTRYRYDAARQVTGVVGPDPDGGGSLKHRAQRITYNADGQVTAIERGHVDSQSDGHWASFTSLDSLNTAYDPQGRPIRRSLTASSATHALMQMSYDTSGRLDCVALRMNPTVFGSPPSSACSLSVEGDYGSDRVTRTTYNGAGQPTLVREAHGTAAEINAQAFTYAGNGQVATLTDAGGNVVTYEYDGFDRLRKVRFPNTNGVGSSTDDYLQYTYDAASNVITERRRDGATFNFTYDNLNRRIEEEGPVDSLDTETTYDLFGRVLTHKLTDSGHTLTNTYDQLSRNLTQVSPIGTVSFQYDAASRLTRITWPDGAFDLQADYLYNTAGDVTEIRENNAGSGPGWLARYTYDNLGQRTSITRGNGVVTNYTYDAASRFDELTQNLPTGSGDDLTLGFGYNPGNQLIDREHSNALYAPTSPSSGASTAYTDNGLNQYASVGGTNFSHDSRGNLTSDGSRTYGYDDLNRLISVSGAASMTLAYDPAGRLYQTVASSVTTRFLYAGAELIAEHNGAGAALRRYVPGPGLDEPIVWYEGDSNSDRRWLIQDERGSVIATTDVDGDAIAAYTYDEYGAPNTWAASASRYRYAGYLTLPEAQLYHVRARAYSPALGRFIQNDPILHAGGMNLYGYVGSDPINYVDPWGLFDWWKQEKEPPIVVTGRDFDPPEELAPITDQFPDTLTNLADDFGSWERSYDFNDFPIQESEPVVVEAPRLNPPTNPPRQVFWPGAIGAGLGAWFYDFDPWTQEDQCQDSRYDIGCGSVTELQNERIPDAIRSSPRYLTPIDPRHLDPAERRAYCIDICSDLALPTRDYGVAFQRCVNQCMGTNDYPEWRRYFPRD